MSTAPVVDVCTLFEKNSDRPNLGTWCSFCHCWILEAQLCGASAMTNAPEINVLVVSPDAEMSGIFSHLFNEIGISTQTCIDPSLAPGVLSTSKFEALVLDLDNVNAGVPLIDKVRASGSSQHAIVFAVATQVAKRQNAFAHGANFAFERPFLLPEIRKSLETARSLMLHDRRRYFRCPLQTAVQITRASGEKLHGTSMNVSSNGLALVHPSILDPGEQLTLFFSIAEAHLSLNALGTVVWDDKHGKAGISFKCDSQDEGRRLASWLDAQFYGPLKPSGGVASGQLS